MESSTLGRSEEELDTIALTQSFWDIRNYRKVVRRIDDGYKLTSDMLKLLQERIDTENKYIKSLHQWSRKWDDHISKSSEHGTLENGWKSLFLSTSRVAEVHTECQRKLEELLKNVSEWRNDHYQKSIGGKLKGCKKAEDGFQKAQKPWERHFDRTNKAKKTYHQLARELESAENALTNAESNPAEFTQEQMTKLREKKEKAEKEKERGQRRYKELLDDLFHHKRHYIEDMEREFDKCQAFEKTRVEFVKESLLKFKDITDLNKQNKVSCIYQVCAHSLNQINSDEDLQWYSVHCGTRMPYKWPEYEEYVSEQTNPNTNTNYGDSFQFCPIKSECSSSNGSLSPRLSTEVYPEKNHIYESADAVWREPPPSSPGVSKENTELPTISSIGEPIEVTNDNDNEDTTGQHKEQQEIGEGDDVKGDLLKAVYEYQGEDEDDLSFKAGDVVRVVEYCDGGWAKAFLGEQYGYIPVSYFKTIKTSADH